MERQMFIAVCLAKFLYFYVFVTFSFMSPFCFLFSCIVQLLHFGLLLRLRMYLPTEFYIVFNRKYKEFLGKNDWRNLQSDENAQFDVKCSFLSVWLSFYSFNVFITFSFMSPSASLFIFYSTASLWFVFAFAHVSSHEILYFVIPQNRYIEYLGGNEWRHLYSNGNVQVDVKCSFLSVWLSFYNFDVFAAFSFMSTSCFFVQVLFICFTLVCFCVWTCTFPRNCIFPVLTKVYRVPWEG